MIHCKYCFYNAGLKEQAVALAPQFADTTPEAWDQPTTWQPVCDWHLSGWWEDEVPLDKRPPIIKLD